MPTAILKPTPFLRLALLGDAAASGATGLLLAVATRPLASVLGLPDPLLRGAALVLLPYVAIIAWAGFCRAPLRWVVQAAVVLNLLWAAGSVELLIWGPVAPTVFGLIFVLAQALIVLGFAVAQWTALRRARRPDRHQMSTLAHTRTISPARSSAVSSGTSPSSTL